MIVKYFVPALLVLLSNCSSPQSENSLTQSERDIIIFDIRQTHHDYNADIKASGLVAEFKYLDSTANFFWIPPGATHSLSYDSVFKVVSRNARFYRSIDTSWDTLRIIPLSHEHAMYTGRLQSTMVDNIFKAIIWLNRICFDVENSVRLPSTVIRTHDSN